LFAGIALSGATLRPDDDDNTALYGPGITNKKILAGDVQPTAGATPLEHRLEKYANRATK
jgi:lipid-binding SYLF domain-containing protein